MNEKFLEKLSQIYTSKDRAICINGFETKNRKPTFRVNTLKSTDKEIEKVLHENNLIFTKLDFLDHAYVLENGREKDLWVLDIFTQGKIYLQSLVSQLPIAISEISNFIKVLDLSAAPGGKTSAAAAKMENTGNIIAVDNNAIRVDKLNFTLQRQ